MWYKDKIILQRLIINWGFYNCSLNVICRQQQSKCIHNINKIKSETKNKLKINVLNEFAILSTPLLI